MRKRATGRIPGPLGRLPFQSVSLALPYPVRGAILWMNWPKAVRAAYGPAGLIFFAASRAWRCSRCHGLGSSSSCSALHSVGLTMQSYNKYLRLSRGREARLPASGCNELCRRRLQNGKFEKKLQVYVLGGEYPHTEDTEFYPVRSSGV